MMLPRTQDSAWRAALYKGDGGFWMVGSVSVLALVSFIVAIALMVNSQTKPADDAFPLDKACYSVIDKAGIAHRSWFPPIPAADVQGVYSFNNDHQWGYVFVPAAMVADRDCLRERYAGQPDLIPPLEGSDEKQ